MPEWLRRLDRHTHQVSTARLAVVACQRLSEHSGRCGQYINTIVGSQLLLKIVITKTCFKLSLWKVNGIIESLMKKIESIKLWLLPWVALLLGRQLWLVACL